MRLTCDEEDQYDVSRLEHCHHYVALGCVGGGGRGCGGGGGEGEGEGGAEQGGAEETKG